MITTIYTAADAALAARIENDTRASGLDSEQSALLIAILSPQAARDAQVEAAMVNALDSGQRIIPVLAAPTPLPALIEHLEPVDFSKGYDFERLRARLQDTAMPMKVHTPSVRTANRRLSYVLVALAVLWFLIALIFIGGGVIGVPQGEYNNVETEIVMTRNYYVDINLPHSTQEAAEFASTAQAVPTALRPILIATATAVAGK